MSTTKRIVVIGGGPAGIAASIEAARAGAGVTMVCDAPPGGRATHASLLPSKVWLHAAELRAMRAGGKPIGRASDAEMADLSKDIDQLAQRESDRYAAHLEDAGVSVMRGLARFVSSHEVAISREGKDEKRIELDKAVIATGSGPFFPEGFFGEASFPDGRFIWAPRFLRSITSLPRTLIVVGGGSSGAEAVHTFNRLGVEVTWIVDELGILPSFDRDLSDVLGGVLVERGVKLVQGKAALNVVKKGEGADAVHVELDGGRTYAAERAFVAIGRTTDLQRLELDKAGLEVEHVISVDGRMQTRVPHLYAAGDVTGAPISASRASAEGWTAGRAAAGAEVPVLDRTSLIHACFTDPEIAKVGKLPAEAVRTGLATRVATLALGDLLRGTMEGIGLDRHRPGSLRIALTDDDRIVGASCIGPRAAELLTPIALAMRAGVGGKTLASMFFATPTLGEAVGAALR